MKTKEILPSKLKSFDELPKDAVINKTVIKNPEWYSYYFDNGIWMPHRKPNINEILKNQFK